MDHTVAVLVGLVIMLAWYATGFRMGMRKRRDPAWSQCADCARRTRHAAGVHQLFVELWGADGVLRHKWPVRIAGGLHSDANSLVVDSADDAEWLLSQIQDRVRDISERQAV